MTHREERQLSALNTPVSSGVVGWTKRVLGWLLAGLLLLLCFLLAVTVVYPKAKGYVPLTILSGSMEPTYPVGTQVFVEPVEGREEAADKVTVGTAITFMPDPDDPTLVTHRVVSVSYKADGSPRYTTQGDANNTPDEEKVGLKQLRGVVQYHVPYVGYLATSMSQDRKDTVAVGLASALFVYAAWNVVLAVRQRRRQKVTESDEDAT